MGTSESFARHATPAASAAPLLTVERASKHRRSGRRVEAVLDAISFDLGRDEYVGLRGPRRSGKTTLLRIAAGIELPDSGAVTWCGRPVAELPRRERTRRLREIAFVAQTQAWRAAPGKPMLDHIALPLLITGTPVSEALSKAREAAVQVAAEAFVDAAPHELPPDALTRLALARALVRDPRLLIVDDPGGGSSDAEQQALRTLLVSLARGRRGMALLVGSREVTMLRGADRIMSLDGSGQLRVPERTTGRVVPFPTVEESSE
ncbi:ATP-binding cassette domain-containing protein [Conexibacter woesei]|uniref:ABC transporter related protein n=1 Tax=Conexibacter woesei (strain DSM 14684 / CCUG 47730 / CIP 108061 / JCM 11494 / NBRC 100937 / ID131577) TaxID=469383 RepID=D3F3A9_CONWI|nr:ATP-binding cassette domain-containing protein [Conexibacter woesei]ADB50389.1 ABC transporter related protein [Conexibacter woesei DSM 14684]